MRLLAWMMLWLAVCPMLLGATVVNRYVDTDDGTDDPGKGTGTGTDAWATLAYAVTQVDDVGDFVTNDKQWTINCAGSTLDTTAVVLSGVAAGGPFTTDATRYLKIVGDGTYTLSAANAVTLTANLEYAVYENLHIKSSSQNANYQGCVYVSNVGTSNIQFIGCSFEDADNDTYAGFGVKLNDNTAVVTLNNCKIINAGQNASARGVDCYAGTVRVYHTTIDNCYTGITARSVSGHCYNKNTIVDGSGGDAYNDSGGTFENTYCTADDATATTYDTGTTCTNNVSPTFTGDYQLTAADAAAVGTGMDLSADPYWYDANVDAWDTDRTDWYPGWFEWVAAGGGLGVFEKGIFGRRILK